VRRGQLGLEQQRRVQERLPGEVLEVSTGSLCSPIDTQIADRATKVGATFGTNIAYARFHEHGVARCWLIEARNAEAPRFTIGDETLFRRRVTHPPLPERSFLRSALEQMGPRIEEGLRAAVVEAIK
jgi:hypothetical protein